MELGAQVRPLNNDEQSPRIGSVVVIVVLVGDSDYSRQLLNWDCEWRTAVVVSR